VGVIEVFMSENHEGKHGHRKGVGADFILPLMAAGYAAYYLYSIADFPWEARINGTFIAAAIWILVAMFVIRTAFRLYRGEVTFQFTGILAPRDKLAQRVLFIGLTALDILLMPWLGFTLTVILFLAAAMWMLGVRTILPMVVIPLAAGSVGYLFFMVALDTRLPRGPVEWLLQPLF
jgi:hypothetical protein